VRAAAPSATHSRLPGRPLSERRHRVCRRRADAAKLCAVPCHGVDAALAPQPRCPAGLITTSRARSPAASIPLTPSFSTAGGRINESKEFLG
jgi:hypothetical protein